MLLYTFPGSEYKCLAYTPVSLQTLQYMLTRSGYFDHYKLELETNEAGQTVLVYTLSGLEFGVASSPTDEDPLFLNGTVQFEKVPTLTFD